MSQSLDSKSSRNWRLRCSPVALHTELNIPNGKSASMKEMLSARERVQSYIEAIEEVLPTLSDETFHNSVVDHLEALAQTFNRELRIYRNLEEDALHRLAAHQLYH